MTVTARDLTVTADANGKIYGASDPALTYTHGTLYNGDTNSVFTGSLARASGENVVRMPLRRAVSQRDELQHSVHGSELQHHAT